MKSEFHKSEYAHHWFRPSLPKRITRTPWLRRVCAQWTGGGADIDEKFSRTTHVYCAHVLVRNIVIVTDIRTVSALFTASFWPKSKVPRYRVCLKTIKRNNIPPLPFIYVEHEIPIVIEKYCYFLLFFAKHIQIYAKLLQFSTDIQGGA